MSHEGLPDPRQLLVDRLSLGCEAIQLLVASREVIDPPEKRFAEKWWQATDDSIRNALRQGLSFRQRRSLNFLFADRLADDAMEWEDIERLRLAASALVDGYMLVEADKTSDEDAREAAFYAAATISRRLNLRRNHWLKQRLDSAEPDLIRVAIGCATALGLELEDFDSCLVDIESTRAVPPIEAPVTASQFRLRSAAEALADRRAPLVDPLPPPEYDVSDRDRMVTAGEIARFRGAPHVLRLDLTKGAAPASALILGDNGTGKSTIADAIEFALQGRIGRSLAFESQLGPMARSLAADGLPDVSVELDNGDVERRVLSQRNGRFVAEGPPIRPGFRLAPITLKRQDILRFLDTGALARGHVFFDYFPVTAEEMAIRPEEMLERLDDEAYELRIERTSRVQWLAEHWEVAEEAVGSKDRLVRELRTRITDGQPLDKFSAGGGWRSVEPTLRTNVEALLHVLNRLASIKRQKALGVETLNPKRYSRQVALLAEVLRGVGDDLSNAFRRIANAPYVDRIDVEFGKSGPVALDLIVRLTDGSHCFPQQVFSEGYRDLTAVLFFVAVAKRAAEHGQAKVLILDDVFQSVDSSIRRGVVEFLLADLKDWQLIFTVHDRLWFEHLRALFAQSGRGVSQLELRRWTFEDGPVIATPVDDPGDALRMLVALGDVGAMCAAAGRLLEQACDQLSFRVGSSVIRRRDDKYTLGDLWPGVRKALKGTRAEASSQKLDNLVALRNLVGAHYNEWAASLSLEEGEEFAGAVLQLLGDVWCADCRDWIERQPNGELRCRCKSQRAGA